jgi:V/A-type H+/Na+-transporting ATPase subunit E
MDKKVTGDERLAAICQMLRKETLEPAQEEADAIKRKAEREATKILEDAKRKADQMLHETIKHLSDERKAFEAALEQASRQAIDLVKEKVEKALFNPAVNEFLTRELKDEKKIAKLLDLVVQKIQEEGVQGTLLVFLGKHLSKDEVVQALSKNALDRIGPQGIVISDEEVGAIIKIVDKHLVIEITKDVLRDLMSDFMRPDFRKFLFVRS